MKYIVIVLIGALASILANRGIAVFRPIVTQYYDGKIGRKELATMSFAISFGLVIGFGIPTSIAATIILIHCLLLTTDIIGVWCKDTKGGMIAAGVIGGVYGLGILVGLESVVKLFELLPYNFISDLGSVSLYITVAFAIFPALAIAYQHTFKKGVIAAGITFLTYILIKKYGIIAVGEFKIALNPEGMAMLVGTILMVFFATQIKGDENSNANENLANMFSAQLSRIRKNWMLLAVMGGLIAAGTSLAIIAGDPTSLSLLSKGEYTSATLAAFARAIGFVPLVSQQQS